MKPAATTVTGAQLRTKCHLVCNLEADLGHRSQSCFTNEATETDSMTFPRSDGWGARGGGRIQIQLHGLPPNLKLSEPRHPAC